MARFKMDDGTIVDTSKATAVFEEGTRWDGRNHISKATNDQWVHQTLYRSAKCRWYVVTTSQWQGATDSAEFVSDQEAARWLLANDYCDIPVELQEHLEAICE